MQKAVVPEIAMLMLKFLLHFSTIWQLQLHQGSGGGKRLTIIRIWGIQADLGHQIRCRCEKFTTQYFFSRRIDPAASVSLLTFSPPTGTFIFHIFDIF